MTEPGEPPVLVTLAGRTFTLGTVYEPAPHVRPYEQGRLLPLRLVGYDPGHPWPAGRGEAEPGPPPDRPRTPRRRLSGRGGGPWGGEPIGDSLETSDGERP